MKFAIKFFPLAITATLFSSSAFAISNEALGEACLEKGKEKLISQAASYGCEIDLNGISVDEVDNRRLNRYKYIWYKAPGTCKEGNGLVELVQYKNGKCD